MKRGQLGWINTEEQTQSLVVALVFRFPEGVSAEGAGHLSDSLCDSAAALGLERYAETIGFGDAAVAAGQVVRAFWEMEA